MYTQCPDCDTAFPVTARVLQQAAGKVRCGRCGHPFNALESLSEDPPESREGREDPNAMLDALEALTGPEDIRIEDTGVEWRVIDEDDVDAAEPGEDDTAEESDTSAVRWYIEDAGPASAGNDAGIQGVGEEADDEAFVTRRKAQQPLQLPAADDEEEELRFDDNTPLPDDFGADVEPPEPPRRRAEDFAEPRSPEFDERQVDLALGEPGEWMALLDELGPEEEEPAPHDEQRPTGDGAEGTQAGDLADTDIRPAGGGDERVEGDAGHDEFPRDIDTQFELQALEMGIELTGSRAPGDGNDETELAPEDDESELATDGVAGARDAGDAIDLRFADDEPGEQELATDTDSDSRGDAAGAAPAEPEAAPETLGDEAEAGVHEQRPRDSSQPGEAGAVPSGAEQENSADEPAPLTDEELTINRLIDQDLMRFAQEQEALATTTGGTRIPRERPHVETIIMEGEFVRTALEGDEADDSTAAPEQRDRETLDTWLGSPPPTRAEEPPAEPRSRRAIAGLFILGLLLLVQVVHGYRDSLATNGAFERAAAPVYRLLGAPLVPGWDARGWQFQATSGGTDATGEVLSISSHIVNEADRALPYPLIYLSLTDRWEEPVGASVLDPTEYLTPDADAAALVPSGEGFTATITVRALSPDASGFKLNVCYPAETDRVRCAIPDFRR